MSVHVSAFQESILDRLVIRPKTESASVGPRLYFRGRRCDVYIPAIQISAFSEAPPADHTSPKLCYSASFGPSSYFTAKQQPQASSYSVLGLYHLGVRSIRVTATKYPRRPRGQLSSFVPVCHVSAVERRHRPYHPEPSVPEVPRTMGNISTVPGYQAYITYSDLVPQLHLAPRLVCIRPILDATSLVAFQLTFQGFDRFRVGGIEIGTTM